MRNPAISGFYPDPSVCRAGDAYYLACSTFEYFPAIPVFRSTDCENWEQIGHVVDRPGQLKLEDVPTALGIWAPTLRYHEGKFWLIDLDAAGRGVVIFTADDPAGPWDDGLTVVGAPGIDHDLAWDEDGTLYVTFSGLILEGEDLGRHYGIQQVRLDPATGHALEAPRNLWSGTGGKFPEAPHLYHIGEWWYLVIAEGGTERGHSVSIARSRTPDGPFENNPANPIYTHRGTNHVVQNAGHADLVETDDGWRMVFLGTRPTGATQSFAQLGRETYQTRVEWVDGWPVVEPMTLTADLPPVVVETDLGAPLGLEWIVVRDQRHAWLAHEGRALVLAARDGEAPGGVEMNHLQPRFVGRRQQHLAARFSVTADPGDGVAGLALRYEENSHIEVEVGSGVARVRVRLHQITHTWEVPAPEGPVRLWIESVPPEGPGFGDEHATCDTLHLGIGEGADAVEIAALDGRYLTSDVCASFTGRVVGPYAARGTARFTDFAYAGADRWSQIVPVIGDAAVTPAVTA